MSRCCLLALIPLFGAPASAGGAPAGFTYFCGAPGALGDLWQADEAGLVAKPVAGLGGLQWLPIDAHGRSALESLRTDRPQWRGDVAGGGRVVLPNAQGSLYRFRQGQLDGSVHFGWLWVDALGAPHALAVQSGSGPAADQDPFLPTVGVANDGQRFLFATTLAAGGDLYEVALASGALELRTAALAPQSWSAGLALLPGFGAAAASDGIWRFAAQSGAQASQLVLPGAPTWFGAEFVASEDGQRLATVAGSAPLSAHVFVFGASGSAAQVTQTPAALSPAGFLPSYNDGPYFALSNDGQLCAWRTVGLGVPREAWVARVPLIAPEPVVQVTQDANYTDTLDQVGLFAFDPAGNLVLAVGEIADPVLGGIESIDMFRVTPPAQGAVSISNLSLSSGVAQPPFLLKGQLNPQLARRIPGTSDVLLFDDAGNNGELLIVSGTGAPAQIVETNIKSTAWIEMAGNQLAVSLQRSNGGKERQLLRIAAGAGHASSTLALLPNGVDFLQPTPRADGRLACLIDLLGQQWVAQIHLPTGIAAVPSFVPYSFGPALAFSSNGVLGFSAGAAAAPALAVGWTPPFVFALPALPSGPLQLVPGA